MALLDGDRFEGRFRDGAHAVDVSDLMRRMVKERLLKFDGRPLFPERIAYTVPYKLSNAEARLYKEVTDYVRDEFNRAEELKLQEQAGKPNARLNSQEARRRADDLQARLEKRIAELDREAQISALPPVVLGGVVVVPAGLLATMTGQATSAPQNPSDTDASAARARAIIMDIEQRLGFEPTDRETEKLGYDIESRDPKTGKLRFLEVKGRVTGAPTITVTKNEILYSFNKPDDFILAIVEFFDADRHKAHYLRRPFRREPDFGVTSVNYDFAELVTRAASPG